MIPIAPPAATAAAMPIAAIALVFGIPSPRFPSNLVLQLILRELDVLQLIYALKIEDHEKWFVRDFLLMLNFWHVVWVSWRKVGDMVMMFSFPGTVLSKKQALLEPTNAKLQLQTRGIIHFISFSLSLSLSLYIYYIYIYTYIILIIFYKLVP